MLLEAPSRGVKQNLEELYEALSKKHAMEFAKLMKEYEEMRTSENDTNEDEVVKDQGLKNKIAEILSLMKEMAGTFTEQEMKDTQRLRKMRCLATSSSCPPGHLRWPPFQLCRAAQNTTSAAWY